jgi:hypothetical protein
MRWTVMGLPILLLAAIPAQAADDADSAKQGYAVAAVELEAGQAYLRGLQTLARSDAEWDHEAPAALFGDAQRAIAAATLGVQGLQGLAHESRFARATEPLNTAAHQLDDARSDLASLAAPAHGLAVPASERVRAVARLQGSLAGAQQALLQAKPALAP